MNCLPQISLLTFRHYEYNENDENNFENDELVVNLSRHCFLKKQNIDFVVRSSEECGKFVHLQAATNNEKQLKSVFLVCSRFL